MLDSVSGQAADYPNTVAIPADFTEVPVPLPSRTVRQLGYPGAERFVMFYYEPRGQEVMWRDGHRYGFGLGGWSAWTEQIVPLAEELGVRLDGWPNPGAALVYDRLLRRAYFADRSSAEQFILPPRQ